MDTILKAFFRLFEAARPLKSDLINEILSNPETESIFLKEFYDAIESDKANFTITFKDKELNFAHRNSVSIPE